MNSDKKSFIAIDIGASSGRHIYAEFKEGKLTAKEIYRFPNGVKEKNGRLCWDVDSLIDNVINGLREAHNKGLDSEYVAIDTFGVDYVLLNKNNEPVSDFVSYRDHRTDNYENDITEKISFRDAYEIAGIQKMAINTVNQLAAQFKANPEEFEKADKLVFIPDYLNFVLTGKVHCEYTDASTSGLLDARTRNWSDKLISALGLPKKIFMKPELPGKIIGPVTDKIKDLIGFCPEVVLIAGHDTGSAVLSVPDRNSIYISCGTWSLIGISADSPIISDEAFNENFTNEGGFFGDIRFLRNITGLWIIQSLKKESGLSYDEIMNLAKENVSTPLRIDINHPDFLSPSSMEEAIASHLPEGTTAGETYAAIYLSLAESYNRAAEGLERVCKKTFDKIVLMGGGVRDPLLCELTEKATGKTLIKGSPEATALGNLAGQLIASDTVKNQEEINEILQNAEFIK